MPGYLQDFFNGDLGGTLKGGSVTTRGARPSSFGNDMGLNTPVEMPEGSPPLINPRHPFRGANDRVEFPSGGETLGNLPGERLPAPVNTDLASQFRRGKEDIEGETGGALGNFLQIIGTPIELLFDIIGQLDRPQQFLWGATLRALEDTDLGVDDTAGIIGAGMRGFIRDDDPQSQNARIQPEQLINAVGKKFFMTEDLDKKLPGVARFALHAALLIGFDPLILVPGAVYAKTGNRLKNMYKLAQASRKATMVATHGVDIRGAATIASIDDIKGFLKGFGRSGGEAEAIYTRIAEDMTSEELDMIRPILGDYLTGMGIRGALVDRINAITKAGRELTPDELSRILSDTGRIPMSTSDVDNISETISRLLGRIRGTPKHEVQYIRRAVIGDSSKTAQELLAYDDNLIIGQLVNRFGLDPLQASNPQVIKAARDIAKAGGKKSDILARVSKTAHPEDLAGFWNSLSQRDRMNLLDEGRHLSSKGSKIRETRSELSRMMSFDAKAARGIIGKLSRTEKDKLIEKMVDAVPLSRKMELQPRIKVDKFFEDLFKKAGIETPDGASAAFRAAQRRAFENGPYIVDPVIAGALRARWMKAGITMDGAMELGEVGAGIRNVDRTSDIPEIMGRGDVMTSMLDSRQWDTKQWHILTGLLDPKQVLPRPIFGMLKLAEDMLMSESNFLAKETEKFMRVGGNVIKEGSELDILIGRALDGHADALARVKAWDKEGEALAAYQHLRAYYDGWAVRFGRAGFKGFEEGAPVSSYFPRIYKNMTDNRAMQELVDIGVLGKQEAADMMLSMRSNPEKWHAAIGPMEMDFVKGNDVYFQHLLPRKYADAIVEQEYSAIRASRAYTHGALKKLHLEPAIKTVNQVMGDPARAGMFNGAQKRYANDLFKRMMGIPGNFETNLNRSLESFASIVGIKLKPRPATRASLFITRRFYSGLLGGNVGFMLKNLSQGINTATELGPLNTLRGVAKLMDPEFRSLARQRNLVADYSQLFERGAFGASGLLRKIDDGLLKMSGESVETINRGIAFNAGLSQFLKEKGLSKKTISWIRENSPEILEEGAQFAHSVANETQFIYGILGRSPIAGDPVGRMALQFMSWPVKQLEFLGNGAFRNPDGPHAGAQFMMRYLMMSGWLSKVAEHANVDAESFTGFGFFPGFASPTTQAMYEMIQGVEAATIEDNTEKSREHFGKFVKQLENMIPAWNQIMKTQGALESYITDEQRGFRERVSRATDQGTHPAAQGLLDSTVNRLLDAVSLPGVSTEQAARFVGLPTMDAKNQREAIKKMSNIKFETARKTQRYLDRYIEAAYSTEPDWDEMDKVIKEAREDGIDISAAKVNEELMQKMTPSTYRLYEGMNLDARAKARAEVGDPRILGLPIAMPPNSLMNTADREGRRP